MVKRSKADCSDALWLESHVLCIPVSHDYNSNDMEYVAECVRAWEKSRS